VSRIGEESAVALLLLRSPSFIVASKTFYFNLLGGSPATWWTFLSVCYSSIAYIPCPPGSSVRRVYNQKYKLLRATEGLSHCLLSLRDLAFASRSRRLVQGEGRDGRSPSPFLGRLPCCLRLLYLYLYTGI